MTVRTACAQPAAPLDAAQLERAYQAPAMFAGGVTGAGTTIAVIIPAAAPHAAADITRYSLASGLPAPQVKVLAYGNVTRPSGSDAAGWEQEGTLDLEMAHAMAPQAQLVYLAVPDSGPAGAALMYDAALGWLAARYRPTVVSYSAGIPEDWDGQNGYRLITASRAGLEAAARAGTTVVASAGDYGPAEPGPGMKLERTVAWPASDPLATAVGGTRLTAAGHGAYASAVFAYARTPDDAGAGGAGVSAVFSRPSWQDGAAAVVGSRRGVADVSMDASSCSPARAYTSTNDLPGRHPGWIYVSGTSVAAPLFAGIVADAAQAAGHPLGVLGPALYQMHGAADGVADITAGTDTIPGMPGYPALPGYDLPTGIGTVASAARFTTALARLAASPALAAVTAGAGLPQAIAVRPGAARDPRQPGPAGPDGTRSPGQ
jgi:subtilase family serine protease